MLKGEGCPQPKTAGRLAQKQPSFKKCVTAYQSRLWVPKMDGTKLITDTLDNCKVCSRQAFQLGRSPSVRRGGPFGNANPGGSRIIAELESLSLKGQGFLDNVVQSRVS